MTQTTIASYNALTSNTEILFKTRTAGYRTGIVRSVGPKTATITNLPGQKPFTARLSRAAWDRYIVRQNVADTTPTLAGITDLETRVVSHLNLMPSGCERAALIRRNLTDARFFIRCCRYTTATTLLNLALEY